MSTGRRKPRPLLTKSPTKSVAASEGLDFYFFLLTRLQSTRSRRSARVHRKEVILNSWIEMAVNMAVCLICVCRLADRALSLKSRRHAHFRLKSRRLCKRNLSLSLSLHLETRIVRTEENQLQQDRAIQSTDSFPSLSISLSPPSLSNSLCLCLSALGNPDCPPRGKPAATGSRNSVYCLIPLTVYVLLFTDFCQSKVLLTAVESLSCTCLKHTHTGFGVSSKDQTESPVILTPRRWGGGG